MDGKALVKTCTNGSSEFLSSISMSVVNMLYNFQLMKYLGENGVAAYGVIMYVAFIFVSVFLGYAIGAAPVVGYHYGAGNRQELHGVRTRSLGIIAVIALAMTAAAEGLSGVLSAAFVRQDAELCALTRHAFTVYSLSYLLCGFNIYASSFFTALNNGLISAIISFLRTLIFQVVAVLLLPMFLGVEGIWWAVVFAEGASLVVSVLCLVGQRKNYGYGLIV